MSIILPCSRCSFATRYWVSASRTRGNEFEFDFTDSTDENSFKVHTAGELLDERLISLSASRFTATTQENQYTIRAAGVVEIIFVFGSEDF